MKEDRKRPGVKVCGKNYPQPWRDVAAVGKTGRAEYRRRDTGERFPYTHRVNGKFIESFATNQWIAPYNIWLLSKYNCHMCFDVCTANAIVKYIYKYITKGADFIKAKIVCGGDEIEAYRSARYVSAAEAAWRLLGFHIMERHPSVTSLRLHLPDEQHVIVDQTLTRAEQKSEAEQTKSDLMLYFGRPTESDFDSLTYLDYNEKYIVNKNGTSFLTSAYCGNKLLGISQPPHTIVYQTPRNMRLAVRFSQRGGVSRRKPCISIN